MDRVDFLRDYKDRQLYLIATMLLVLEHRYESGQASDSEKVKIISKTLELQELGKRYL